MSLQKKISQDLINALKRGDSARRSVLSMVKSAIHNQVIRRGKQQEGLSDEEVMEVLMAEAKKRRDSIEEYKKAGRIEQANQEEFELEVVKEYLPKQMDEESVREELKNILEELGTSDKKDFGRIMSEAMKRFKGKADGALVKAELEKILK